MARKKAKRKRFTMASAAPPPLPDGSPGRCTRCRCLLPKSAKSAVCAGCELERAEHNRRAACVEETARFRKHRPPRDVVVG